MSKFFCTLTIFAGMIGLIWFGFANEMRCYIWWDGSGYSERKIYYFTWVILNICMPIALLAAGLWIVYMMWRASGAICGKLQAHFTNKSTER